jgi:large-conductance mechanosensitive channel
MSCSDSLRQITGWTHGFSILVVIIVVGIDLYNLANNNLINVWFPLALAFMMLLRIPSQMCVAMNVYNGWFSVITSVIDFFLWIIIAFIIHKKWKEIRKKNQEEERGTTPSATEYETY